MENNKDKNTQGLPWYSCSGPDNDVIVSTRVRLARNLANFPFPCNFRGDDAQRVQILVFDAFSHFQNPDNFHLIDIKALDFSAAIILSERGILKIRSDGSRQNIMSGTGVIMSSEGNSSCTINSGDHIHIASFAPGLLCRDTLEECRSIDVELQKSLQFAASYDFGFLTSALSDAGSGVKISIRVHIPGIVFENRLKPFIFDMKKRGFNVTPVFAPMSNSDAAPGAYYQISTISSLNGSEFDQMAAAEAAGKYIAKSERKIYSDYADNKSTVIRNAVIRAYSIAKFSVLISLIESIDIISKIQFGLNLGLISGIDNNTLCGLLYRVQPGHLEFLMNSGTFIFEHDIENNIVQRTDRLRAIVLQEAFNKISLGNI